MDNYLTLLGAWAPLWGAQPRLSPADNKNETVSGLTPRVAALSGR